MVQVPQDSLSKRLHEPSGIVMLSGGIDSVAVLKKVLEETDEKIYAHHIHIKNHEGINNIRRYKAEALALRKIIPYMKKNFRDFHYSESTIDTRQICNLRKGVFDEEGNPDYHWGILDRALIAVLVKAVQELSTKVTALENA